MERFDWVMLRKERNVSSNEALNPASLTPALSYTLYNKKSPNQPKSSQTHPFLVFPNPPTIPSTIRSLFLEPAIFNSNQNDCLFLGTTPPFDRLTNLFRSALKVPNYLNNLITNQSWPENIIFRNTTIVY